jgi:hypothetical protein
MALNMSEKGPSPQVVGGPPKLEAPSVCFAPSQAPAKASAAASASATNDAPAAAAAAAATSNGAVADPGRGRATEAQGLQVRKNHEVTNVQQC